MSRFRKRLTMAGCMGLAALLTGCSLIPGRTHLEQTEPLTIIQNTQTKTDFRQDIDAMLVLIRQTEDENQRLLDLLNSNYTQADMNDVAYERKNLWQDVFEAMMDVLKQDLDDQTLQLVETENTAWLQEKEIYLNARIEELGGGSLTGTVKASICAV